MKKFDGDAIKEFFSSLRLNPLEWMALGAALIFAGVVTFFYFQSTQPLKAKIEDLRRREKSLGTQVQDEVGKKKGLEEQRANAEKIVDSLERFEGRLRDRRLGMPAIIDEVTQIAKASRVKAGDITFRVQAPEPLAGEEQPGASPAPAVLTKRDKMPNVYEGFGIDTTVEGDYHDLRRFISALERSRNFVIINAIALQSVDEKRNGKFKPLITGSGKNPAMPQMQQQPGGDPGIVAGGLPDAPTKTVVSLKIEMETHFSRQERPEAKVIPASATPHK